MMRSQSKKFVAVAGAVLALGMFAADAAEARRGGSFGSRGGRTYSAPAPTRTAPQQTAPVQRSMTEKAPDAQQPGATSAAAARAPAAAPAQAPRRGGMFGGLAGGLLGGLALGGLIGMLMGNGFGAGMAGITSLLFQLGVVALVVWLALKLFRRRQPQPAFAAANAHARNAEPFPFAQAQTQPTATYTPVTPVSQDPAITIAVSDADRGEFERLLREVQEAFGREDYGALRERTTPEIMSYLAEEMSQNALQGQRNEVRDVRLLEADVAEAWAEADREYVTAALRFESIDVMRDRQTGELKSGEERPSETTELWTFVRRAGEPWKLSAIQEA